MAVWRLNAAACNHKGILRAENEDNFYLNGRWLSQTAMAHGGRMSGQSTAEFQLYAVCDGLGGEEAGELASLTAVQALSRIQTDHLQGITDLEVLQEVRRLSDRVQALSPQPDAHTGTTLTACLWQQGAMRILNIGDSRVYRLRRGKLTQLSTDHSEVQRMVDLGLMTPYEARVSPNRHIITQYLGIPSDNALFQPSLSKPLNARKCDWYLLCSDGLVDMVENAVIRRTLLAARDAAEAADRLVQQALDNGGHDNVTVVCIHVEDPHGKCRCRRLLSRLWSWQRG